MSCGITVFVSNNELQMQKTTKTRRRTCGDGSLHIGRVQLGGMDTTCASWLVVAPHKGPEVAA